MAATKAAATDLVQLRALLALLREFGVTEFAGADGTSLRLSGVRLLTEQPGQTYDPMPPDAEIQPTNPQAMAALQRLHPGYAKYFGPAKQ